MPNRIGSITIALLVFKVLIHLLNISLLEIRMGGVAKKINKTLTQQELTFDPLRFASRTLEAPCPTFYECFAKIC